jgi:hypothetical protein
VLADAQLLDELTEGAWEGVIYTAIGVLPSSGHPLLDEYMAAAARVAPGERVSEFFLGGFRYAEPLGEALQRAGRDLTTESLVAALESMDGWQGTGPPITFTPERRQGTRAMFLARAIEGGDAESLTDWIESDIDIEQAIRILEGSD